MKTHPHNFPRKNSSPSFYKIISQDPCRQPFQLKLNVKLFHRNSTRYSPLTKPIPPSLLETSSHFDHAASGMFCIDQESMPLALLMWPCGGNSGGGVGDGSAEVPEATVTMNVQDIGQRFRVTRFRHRFRPTAQSIPPAPKRRIRLIRRPRTSTPSNYHHRHHNRDPIMWNSDPFAGLLIMWVGLPHEGANY